LFRKSNVEDGEEEDEEHIKLSKDEVIQNVVKNWINFVAWLAKDDIVKYNQIYKMNIIEVFNFASVQKEAIKK
jgi:hypothetical protein